MKQITLVNILAAQIRSLTGANRSVSMRQAWAIIKTTPSARLLTFTKMKTGEICRRVVSENWTSFYTPVGGCSTTKEGQCLLSLSGNGRKTPAFRRRL